MLGESQTTGVHQGHVGMLLLLCLSPMEKSDERQGYMLLYTARNIVLCFMGYGF
jgi:hypothetical protein